MRQIADFYTSETLRLVNRIYARDFHAFAYSMKFTVDE